MIEIYAITDRCPADEAAAPELYPVTGAGLVALCAPAVEKEPTPELLWRHEEIVESLMEQCDLLPVRYGTRVGDESAAAQVLAERQPELSRALERVRGAVEVSLRVSRAWPGTTAPRRPAGGGDYMRARARREGAHAELVAAVHRPLARIARASTERRAPQEPELMRAAYLVGRGDLARFTERVAELQDVRGDLLLLCTGPWPPYSFTGA